MFADFLKASKDADSNDLLLGEGVHAPDGSLRFDFDCDLIEDDDRACQL